MKKILLLTMMAILALTASAYDFMVDGIAYNYLNGQSGSEVEVTYTKYQSSSNYSGLNTANIPSSVTYSGTTYSVTSIGVFAFMDCSGLTSVTIPNSVTSIGNHAFHGCSGLTSVTIPNSVISIGYDAFGGCSGLTSVTIPNSVTSIGNQAFDNTPWYDNLPNGLVYVGLVAFKYNGTMPANTSISLREGTKGIAGGAFYGCSGLTSVTIPNSVTSIGAEAFRGCSGLTSITIPNSVTSISGWAFTGCRGLTDVTIPNSVTLIGEYAFSGCTGLTSVTIPNSVTSIGGWAFYGCTGVTSVTIGNSVTFIGDCAFYGCSGLTRVNITDITKWFKISFHGSSSNPLFYAHHLYLNNVEIKNLIIPNSVTIIGSNAFYNCTGLTSVTIPNSVTIIGNKAFSDCSGLTEIRSKIFEVNNVGMSSDVFQGVPISSCVLKIPFGTANAYRNTYPWSAFSDIHEFFLRKSDTYGDLNYDYAVDGNDINIMVNQLLKKNDYLDEDGITDLNDDGKVNGIDLHEMISIVLGQ